MSGVVKENKAKIILALHRARGAAPMGYISRESGIENLRRLLWQLEEEGFVRRAFHNSWSPSLAPEYELTSKANKLLQQPVATSYG